MSEFNLEAALRTMLLIRAFEEAASRLLANGEIPGFLHLSIGQEGVAAGVNLALRRSDRIATTHRGHGHCIAKGGRVDRMIGELFGNDDGYCAGRSGSMHIAAPDVGILGANAIVGGGLPSAVGSAWASQTLGTDEVTVAFFGEGAVAEGVFHECLNLASLWALPIIFVCENNQYAELSHVSTHLSADDVAAFGAAYGIATHAGDGNDARAVHELTAAAAQRARDGAGPTLLELNTYRIRGHFEGDGQRYRPKDEVAAWRDRDPLTILGQSGVEEGTCTKDDIETWTRDARQEVDDAIESARATRAALAAHAVEAGEPGARLTANVYADADAYAESGA